VDEAFMSVTDNVFTGSIPALEVVF